jgi:sugar/nucleoside kinase (ribokinase family)
VIQRAATLTVAKDVQAGVWMFGAVGDDQLGVAALETLRADGVQTDHVLVTPDAPTGTALIAVDANGENQIVVAPGANALLDAAHVVDALDALRPHVLLVSLEMPERTIRAAVTWADGHAVTVIVNPAPFQQWVRDLLQLATFVTPNEGEFAQLMDLPSGVTVIETRGAEGARIHMGTGMNKVLKDFVVRSRRQAHAADGHIGNLHFRIAFTESCNSFFPSAVLICPSMIRKQIRWCETAWKAPGTRLQWYLNGGHSPTM